MILSTTEIVEHYLTASVKKVNTPSGITLGKGIMAGMMIAFGAACSNVAVHDINNVGIARLIAGMVFPVGLMMVVLMGAELFTGDCMVIMGFCDKKITLSHIVRTLVTVYIGNFIGSILMATLIYFSGQLDYSGGLLGAYTIKTALFKLSMSPDKQLISGILCNILVCMAVLMAMAAKDVAGKLLSCFFVIMVFVTGGFEHCVANMYYITAGILAKGNGMYLEKAMSVYGITDVSGLNMMNMFIHNLLPVTVGNIVGGMLFVGIPVYYMEFYKKYKADGNARNYEYKKSLLTRSFRWVEILYKAGHNSEIGR